MVLGSTWWFWVVWGGTGWYLVVLGQYRVVMFVTWWYWVSIGRNWMVLGQFRTVAVCTIGPICLSKFYKNSLIYDQV